jgi:HAD superfamily hydrolase (TIGR01509 family)
MNWIHDYGLFLFDFDGLLVNTEELHYLAYKKMCNARGFHLDWNFNRYCQAAHYQSTGLRDQIYAHLPALQSQEPNWDILYAEKRQAILDLIDQGAVQLMPGVDALLKALQIANIPRCVVTHSPDPLIKAVRNQNPLLDSIPFWITREHYSEPKPNPECYLKAIESFSAPSTRIIGFEDTPRGLQALLGTRAQAVLICTVDYPELPSYLQQGALHYPSFNKVNILR